MYVEDLDLNECIYYCIKHRKCVTINYSSFERLCELCHFEFDEVEGDTEAVGWLNYGKQDEVNGGFSEWRNKSDCSVSCGGGMITQYRLCDNPPPQYGGKDCAGDNIKTERCNTHPCPDQCPSSHPFAFYRGTRCCLTKKENVIIEEGEACDGGELSLFSLCCENDRYIRCPSDHCVNNEALWIMQTSLLCYSGSLLPESGEFRVTKSGYVESVMLVHRSGWIKCEEGTISYWGCVYSDDNCEKDYCLGTVIVDKSNNIILPTGVSFSPRRNFNLIVYGNRHDGDTLIYPTTQLMKVSKNDVLKVTTGIATLGLSMDGKHCIDVYFRYGTGENVALRKPSKQSSTYGNKDSCKAELANDGYFDTRSATYWRSGKGWWEVDLQRSIEIKTIILHLSPYALRKNFYEQLVITTRNTDTEEWTVCNNVGKPSLNPVEVRCDRKTIARHIRVSLKNTKPLYLIQVLVTV